MSINKEIIDNLKANIDIVELIGRFLKISRHGQYDKGLCPFHKENTPSFTVTSKRGIYKCYGCGASGDHITFLQKHENLSFIEAIHWLAREYKLDIPTNESQKMRQPHFEKRKSTKSEKPGTFVFDYVNELTEDDIRIWFAKEIVKERYLSAVPKGKDGTDFKHGLDGLYEILDELHWKKVKSYARVKDDGFTTVISSTEDYPIYAREEHWTDEESGEKGTFTKIYQPLHHDKKYKWAYSGVMKGTYINGLSLLNVAYEKLVKEENEKRELATKSNGQPDDDADDEGHGKRRKKKKSKPQDNLEATKVWGAIICSGERDAVNARAMGYFPLWFNSESAKVSPGMLDNIFKLAKNVYNVPDIDEPGLENMHKLSMNPADEKYLDIKNIILPAELKKKWSNGKPCKDLRDYLTFYTKWDFIKLLKTAMPYKFWTYSESESKFGALNSRYNIDNEVLFFFLQQNGYWRYQLNPDSLEGNDQADKCFIKIEDNVVYKVNSSDIKNWVVEFLKSRYFTRELINTIHRSTYFNSSIMEALMQIKPNFTAHTTESQLMFFSNKIWEISAYAIDEHKPGISGFKRYYWGDKNDSTKVEIQEIKTTSKSVKNYVWRDKLIQKEVEITPARPFTITWTKETGFDITINDHDCLFLRFLKNTSAVHWDVETKGVKMPDGTLRKTKTPEEITEEKLQLINKLFVLGYLSHRQKFKHKPWFVYGMEQHVTGEGKSSGGTGKSAFFEALKLYLRVQDSSGTKMAEQDAHRFGSVSEHVDIVYIDDMHEFFSWREVYQHTTSSFPVNPKGKPGFSIPYHLSPKLCGTGNFAVRDMQGSTNRRLLFLTFSNYYHSADLANGMEERTIHDDLGKQLLDDFDKSDWNKFYNLIAESIRFYLWNPTGKKIDPPMENVLYKNLRSHIGETFINWAETIFHPDMENTDCYISRESLQDHYSKKMKDGQMNKSALAPQTFKEKLDMFCKLNDMTFMPEEIIAQIPNLKKNEKQTKRVMKWVADLGESKEFFYIQTIQEDGTPTELRTNIWKIDITKPNNPTRKAAESVAAELQEGDSPPKDDLPF